MIRKIICCFLTVLMCVSLVSGCGVKNEIDSLERYVYTEKDNIWDSQNLGAWEAPANDEEYMLQRLRGVALIFEGVITEAEYKRNNPGNDHYPTVISTISISDVWYGKATDNEIIMEFSSRQIGQDRHAPQKGDHVVMFLIRQPTGEYSLRPTCYETFYILNPPDDTLLPLRTFEISSSLVGKPKEELRSAIGETLNDIAEGKTEPMHVNREAVVDAITDKYVKKYERKQKWRKLFS